MKHHKHFFKDTTLAGLQRDGGSSGRAATQAKADALRKEIALAKQRVAGLQAAINSREKSLARLVAQLAMSSPASQTAPAFAG